MIVRELTNRDVRVSIIPNGFLFTEQILKTLEELNVESVAVSLDGTEEIHNAFQQKGSFQRAITVIGQLTKSGIPTSVITTLHSKNLPYLDDMYNLMKETQIFAW